MKNNFYITTPIYYVNDIPHIGHAYTTILADVIARYQRSLDKNVFFLTGLDEHGQKVQDAANSNKTDPLSHCNNMSKRFTDLWAKLHISNNDFIRTTQKRHIKVVQNILNEVMKNGDIYEDEYEGLYSVSEERFITEKEADTGDFHDIKKLKEKNYFFKMSKYQKNLIDHIHSNPQFIMPSHRKNEIIGFLNNPLNDLCISRPKSRLSWGIELPFDSDYVTYVWFDALINYITAPGYLENQNNFEKLWPANIHLIGKDILTTHAVYWPTMLLSAGIALPKTIFAHGWWLTGDDKMSKSKGNVINPMDLIDDYGVDPVRYYLMREMVLGQDANFTVESFNNRYNSDLANDFGNLLSRISTLINKNFNGIIPDVSSCGVEESKIEKHAEQLIIKYDDLMNRLLLNEAIEEIFQYIRSINRYFEHKAPWKLVKKDLSDAATVLYVGSQALIICSMLLHPIMPNRVKKLLDVFNVKSIDKTWGSLPVGSKLAPHQPLFPRIKSN